MKSESIYGDATLGARIAEGDEAAFYVLFETYMPVFRAYVRKATRSEKDTEDILQDIFTRIWLHRDKLAEVDNLRAWVFTVAARVCLNHVRTQISLRKKLEGLATAAALQTSGPETPSERLQAGAIRSLIDGTLAGMPERRRQIFRMNREMGLKPAAIAEALGMPVGTVKNQLSAALAAIREALERHGYGIIALLFFSITIH